MRIGSKLTTGWKATISVAMSNYIEAGSIIAIATSLGLWQKEFGLTKGPRRNNVQSLWRVVRQQAVVPVAV
ncbi:MAG TPA: hypothetical protein VIK32_07240, partial [Candidatus Limnocylindrales bacterium]